MALRFDKDKITKLSSEVFSAVESMKAVARCPKEAFLRDPYRIAAVKYFLIVSIEAAIDMCNHVISLNKLRVPDDYADTFRVIGETAGFDKGFLQTLTRMARFRNRLVHIYWEVDDDVIYDVLPEHVDNIEQFFERFMAFLSGEGRSGSGSGNSTN